jgi:prevent-host-death family protein
MMQSIGVSELRANLSGFLEQVQAGEIIVITSRGQEVARLVPPDVAVVAAREKLAELRQKAEVGDVLSPLDEVWEAGA